MTAINLTVDIYGTRPSWSINKNYLTAYRIYNNGDLLTERSWIWNNNTVIQENIWLYADINIPNVLTITPIVNIQEQAIFNLNNFTVLNHPVNAQQTNDQAISFILQ